jgi:hypothetical protein
MERLSQDQINSLLNQSSFVNSMATIPLEHSQQYTVLPSFSTRPLMRSLNKLYARLKGLTITETPLPTIQQHEHENTDLELNIAGSFDEGTLESIQQSAKEEE